VKFDRTGFLPSTARRYCAAARQAPQGHLKPEKATSVDQALHSNANSSVKLNDSEQVIGIFPNIGGYFDDKSRLATPSGVHARTNPRHHWRTSIWYSQGQYLPVTNKR
jgi:hypothetical protein